MSNLYGKGKVLERKVLSNPGFNFIDVHSISLFIDDDDNIFTLVEVWRTDSTKDFLCINNNWGRVDKYGWLLNGFIKDGQFYLAFHKDEDVVIYNVQENIKPISHARLNYNLKKPLISPRYNRILPVSGHQRLYYLLGSSSHFPADPLGFLSTLITGGYGTYYAKPFLEEIRENEIVYHQKIRYGGKINETFIAKEAVTEKDSIHLLGFRGHFISGSGFVKNKPIILHYAAYDTKKKKNTRKHSVHTKTPEIKFDKNTAMNGTDMKSYYGPLSMDNLEDDIFVVFSWVERHNYRAGFNINNIKSDIYFWQFYNDSPGDPEKIGEGFMPLVKVDSIGHVHVFWVNNKGGLVHKTKANSHWSKESIILNNIDLSLGVSTRYISAEFGKDNNLNVIFPSAGNLVYAKINLEN
jgi:hypothetical protein